MKSPLDPRPSTRREMEEFLEFEARLFEGLREPFRYTRKLWEWIAVAKLYDVIRPQRAIGFGVGREPLVAWMASLGVGIVVATDNFEGGEWGKEQQYAASGEDLNDRRICDPEIFRRSVTFVKVDMRDEFDHSWMCVKESYDFVWSCCALEHLGGKAVGRRFIERSLDLLRPGGIAVHTTELNLTPQVRQIDYPHLCAYDRHDIDAIIRDARGRGYVVFDPDWNDLKMCDVGNSDPKSEHMTYRLGDVDLTSYILPIIRTRHRFVASS